jgi:hypothetical protein
MEPSSSRFRAVRLGSCKYQNSKRKIVEEMGIREE